MIDMLPTDNKLMNDGNYAIVCTVPANAEQNLSLHDYKVIGSLNMKTKAGSNVKLTQEQNHALNRMVVFMRYNCTVDTSLKLEVPPPALGRKHSPKANTKEKTNAKEKTTNTKVADKTTTKKIDVVKDKMNYNPEKDYRAPTYQEMVHVKRLVNMAVESGNWEFSEKDYLLYRHVMHFNKLNGPSIWHSIPF